MTKRKKSRRLAAKNIDRKDFKTTWAKIKLWIQQHPLLFPVLSTVALMIVLFFTSKGMVWFQASILQVPAPFDGTVAPLKDVPKWSKWNGNIRTTLYSEVPPSELMKLPKYNTQELSKRKKDVPQTDNQITYPVVYLGSYENDHQEDTGSHLAIDIRTPVGTPIYSIASAKVTKVKRSLSGFGYHIVLEHRNVPDYPDASKTTTFYSTYAHMSAIYVEEGQLLSKDHLIGLSGNTGTSTSPHLHFQIDRDTAPWHPWWPFSSLQASQANVSFFEAINAGLGKKEAKKMTINPLLWVQIHYNPVSNIEDSNIISSPTLPSEAIEKTMQNPPSFFIESPKQIPVNIPSPLVVEARDESGVIDPSYQPSSLFTITSTADDTEFPEIIQFEKGKTTVMILSKSTGTFSVTLIDGNRKGSVVIEALNDENAVVAKTTRKTPETIISKETQPKESEPTHSVAEKEPSQELTFEVSGETFGMIGQAIEIEILAKNADGNIEKNPKFSTPLLLKTSGNGSFSKTTLTQEDFTEGKARITYKSLQKESAILTARNGQFDISVIDQVKAIKKFRIETDGKYMKNKKELFQIISMDDTGKRTPASVFGAVKISLESGEGDIEKTTITSSDFIDGIAEISVTPKKGTLRLRAQAGVIFGVSDNVNEEEEKNTSLFPDVPTTHKNAQAIQHLVDLKIVNGYPDGTFQPERTVSRVEAAKMIVLGLSLGESPIETLTFSDTDNALWYATFVGRLMNLSVVKGYDDGTFQPTRTVNRAEFFKMLLISNKEEIPQTPLKAKPYTDVLADAWFAGYSQIVKDKKLLDTLSNGMITPGAGMTRGDAAEMMYRILQPNR